MTDVVTSVSTNMYRYYLSVDIKASFLVECIYAFSKFLVPFQYVCMQGFLFLLSFYIWESILIYGFLIIHILNVIRIYALTFHVYLHLLFVYDVIILIIFNIIRAIRIILHMGTLNCYTFSFAV